MIKQPTYQDYKKMFANRPKPFAFVDLEMLNANIRQVLAYSGDKPIRIGSKSVRCTSILRHILARSAGAAGAAGIKEGLKHDVTDWLESLESIQANEVETKRHVKLWRVR